MSMTVEEAIRVLVALRDWDGELRIEIEDGYVPIKAIAKSWNSAAIVVPDVATEQLKARVRRILGADDY